jgi:hypothetical protein
MTFNWKRERFDNPVILFNNQSLSMSKDSSNDILSLKSSLNEIWVEFGVRLAKHAYIFPSVLTSYYTATPLTEIASVHSKTKSANYSLT